MRTVIQIIIISILMYSTAAASVLNIQHAMESKGNPLGLIRRSSSDQKSMNKSNLSRKGKQIEEKMMKEPKQLRTPQLRQTLIEQELTKQSEKAKKAGNEKIKFEQKINQKGHSIHSWKGKALSILPFSAEHKLKKANNRIEKANSAFQDISKDLNYHQRQGHIHDLASISRTVQEIQQGGKARFANQGQGTSNRQQGSNHLPRISHSQPSSRATSPNRPLLGSSHPASHLVTPTRSPNRSRIKTAVQHQSHSRAS